MTNFWVFNHMEGVNASPQRIRTLGFFYVQILTPQSHKEKQIPLYYVFLREGASLGTRVHHLVGTMFHGVSD